MNGYVEIDHSNNTNNSQHNYNYIIVHLLHGLYGEKVVVLNDPDLARLLLCSKSDGETIPNEKELNPLDYTFAST